MEYLGNAFDLVSVDSLSENEDRDVFHDSAGERFLASGIFNNECPRVGIVLKPIGSLSSLSVYTSCVGDAINLRVLVDSF